MNLFNFVCTVIFLGVVALSLLAVLDVFSLRPRAKHTRKPGHTPAANGRRNARLTREEAFTGEKPEPERQP